MPHNMILHCGANAADLSEVVEVPTPEPTDSWHPIPHITLINTITNQLSSVGLSVRNAEFGLWKDGLRMFGAFELYSTNGVEDYSLVVGLRNSHDMSFSAGLAVGSRVFVCDNLAFSGEITIARKHTRWIERDLPRLAAAAVGRISLLKVRQDERIAAYKEHDVEDRTVHDLLIRAVDARVIPNARIPKVLEQWRKPVHQEFAPRNAWSLFNAFTETYKGTNQLELPRRTTGLHGLLDQLTGVVLSRTENTRIENDFEDAEVVDRFDPNQGM